jgi:hypothetical protein
MGQRIVHRVAVIVAGTLVAGAAATGTAAADGGTPWPGSLCTAKENIQFYTDTVRPVESYTVAAGDYIRVMSVVDGSWAYGHGEGHQDRYFIWRHSNLVERLRDCH